MKKVFDAISWKSLSIILVCFFIGYCTTGNLYVNIPERRHVVDTIYADTLTIHTTLCCSMLDELLELVGMSETERTMAQSRAQRYED